MAYEILNRVGCLKFFSTRTSFGGKKGIKKYLSIGTALEDTCFYKALDKAMDWAALSWTDFPDRGVPIVDEDE